MGQNGFFLVFLCALFLVPNSAIEVNSTVPSNKSQRNAIGPIRIGYEAVEMASEIPQKGRKVVAITSEVDDRFHIWCASKDGDMEDHYIFPGRSMAFSFRPAFRFPKGTIVWCTLEYKGFWARWDVYNDFAPYISSREKVYRYGVRPDGIFINGTKVTGLAIGQHRYILWDHYDDRSNPFGVSLIGYVDSGICNTLPEWMDDKTSAIVMCNYQCVILYEHLKCVGLTEKVQVQEGCFIIWLPYFDDKTSSVQGC